MKKTAIHKQAGNRIMEGKIQQEELLRRLKHLENERVRYQRDSEEKLRRCEAKYLAMLESVDAHITLVDRNLQILWANKQTQKIFGRDIVGKFCCQAFHGKKGICGNKSSCLTRKTFRDGGHEENRRKAP